MKPSLNRAEIYNQDSTLATTRGVSMMKYLEYLKQPAPRWAVRASVVGLLASIILYGISVNVQNRVHNTDGQPVPIPATVAKYINDLEYDRQTLDLAIEFGYDPLIVSVVRELSGQVIDSNSCEQPRQCPAWRMLRTEEDLTWLILSIIQIESNGDPRARGDDGRAYGLTQMWMDTAVRYDDDVSGADLLTIDRHLEIAFKHFVYLLERREGNVPLALLDWNRGENRVDRLIALGESPANGYARRVFSEATLRNARYE